MLYLPSGNSMFNILLSQTFVVITTISDAWKENYVLLLLIVLTKCMSRNYIQTSALSFSISVSHNIDYSSESLLLTIALSIQRN